MSRILPLTSSDSSLPNRTTTSSSPKRIRSSGDLAGFSLVLIPDSVFFTGIHLLRHRQRKSSHFYPPDKKRFPPSRCDFSLTSQTKKILCFKPPRLKTTDRDSYQSLLLIFSILTKNLSFDFLEVLQSNPLFFQILAFFSF